MDISVNSVEQRDLIVQQLREAGCRITKQRLVVLDIILNSDPSCVKEIYREAIKIDKNIGTATVYRMVNTLEEIGVLNRKNMYQVDCSTCDNRCPDDDCDSNCMGSCSECETRVVVTLDDDTKLVLSRDELSQLLEAGLHATGRVDNSHKISRLAM
ncbi:MAG: transcriptional repressor [Pseudobutyrivibrio sp.]|nr:transcriptional repressor [Pseudobutyrivibrio sp.]